MNQLLNTKTNESILHAGVIKSSQGYHKSNRIIDFSLFMISLNLYHFITYLVLVINSSFYTIEKLKILLQCKNILTFNENFN